MVNTSALINLALAGGGLTDPSPIIMNGLKTRFGTLLTARAFDVASSINLFGAAATFAFKNNGVTAFRTLAPLGLLADYVIRLDVVRVAGRADDLRVRSAEVDNIRLPGVPSALTSALSSGIVSAFSAGMVGTMFAM